MLTYLWSCQCVAQFPSLFSAHVGRCECNVPKGGAIDNFPACSRLLTARNVNCMGVCVRACPGTSAQIHASLCKLVYVRASSSRKVRPSKLHGRSRSSKEVRQGNLKGGESTQWNAGQDVCGINGGIHWHQSDLTYKTASALCRETTP